MQEDNEYRDDEVVMEGLEDDDLVENMEELVFWDEKCSDEADLVLSGRAFRRVS